MLGCDFAVILLFFFVRAALPPQVLVCPSAFPPLPEGQQRGPGPGCTPGLSWPFRWGRTGPQGPPPGPSHRLFAEDAAPPPRGPGPASAVQA